MAPSKWVTEKMFEKSFKNLLQCVEHKLHSAATNATSNRWELSEIRSIFVQTRWWVTGENDQINHISILGMCSSSEDETARKRWLSLSRWKIHGGARQICITLEHWKEIQRVCVSKYEFSNFNISHHRNHSVLITRLLTMITPPKHTLDPQVSVQQQVLDKDVFFPHSVVDFQKGER